MGQLPSFGGSANSSEFHDRLGVYDEQTWNLALRRVLCGPLVRHGGLQLGGHHTPVAHHLMRVNRTRRHHAGRLQRLLQLSI